MARTENPIYDLARDQPSARIGIFLTPLFAVFGTTILLIWGVTEWVAWQFQFHPNLGSPIFIGSGVLRPYVLIAGAMFIAAAAGVFCLDPHRRALFSLSSFGLVAIVAAYVPVYEPWGVFLWMLRFGDRASAEPIFNTAIHAIVWPAHFVFLVAMFVAWRRAKENARNTDAHGSARWANETEIENMGLLGEAGLFLGLYRRGRRDRGAYLRHEGAEHVLGFAPTRSGKGVGWVVPTLLDWRGSAVVHDIKGENWELTAGFRSQYLGNHCLRFDPTSQGETGARYNPLAEVRRGPKEVRDAQNIAEMLVDPDGAGRQDHWDVTAAEILVGTILHVLYVARDKTLRGCLDLLTSPHESIETVLSGMLSTEHDPTGSEGWTDRTSGLRTKTHPVVAGAARSLLNKSENERSSVVSSAVRCLSLFRDEIVTAKTSTSDFAIDDLVYAEQGVTLYLVVPPSDASRTRILIRMLINQIGKRLTEELEGHDVQGRGGRRKLLLMMDEFPTLGRLDFFETQLAYLAGYGIRAFLIVQDLSQLFKAYGANESILSNCHVRLAFAPNKIETARLLSEMAGVMTVQKARRMYSGNRLALWLGHVMESEEEMQRPLVTPDEVLRLPSDNALIFSAGERPILAQKARYFDDEGLLERSTISPPENRVSLPSRASDWSYVSPEYGGVSTDPDGSDHDVASLVAATDRDVDPELDTVLGDEGDFETEAFA